MTAALIASMAIFGTIGVVTEYVPLSSAEIALFRAAIAAVLLAGFLCLSGKGLSFAAVKREWPLLLISGVALSLNWVLLFEAYRYTTVSVATLSYYAAPMLVTVLSAVLYRERITWRQAACFVLATVGLVLMIGVSVDGGSNGRGILFGLGAACGYATVVLLNKRMKELNGIQRSLWQFTVSVPILFVYVALTDGFSAHTLSGVGWGCIVLLGVVHTAVAYALYFSAVKVLPGPRVALLSYLDPLLAVVLSATVLAEPLSLWQGVGGALILVFTLLSEWSFKRKRAPR